jgi:hypothetical protein
MGTLCCLGVVGSPCAGCGPGYKIGVGNFGIYALTGELVAEIVLVHGIGQENKDAARLLKDWVAALASGLEAAGASGDVASRVQTRQVSVTVAYYGDLFRKGGTQGGDELSADGDELPAGFEELASQLGREWLRRAAMRSSDEDSRSAARAALADADADAGAGEDMGARSILREMLAGMGRISWFARPSFAVASRVAWRDLRQVTAYMMDIDGTRQKALSRVAELTDSSTRVLIGHSLGSVVAYEAAHRLDVRCPLLLTLGSPLGLDTIVYDRLVPQPPCYPAHVDRWVNVADLDDLVAADPNLRPRFEPLGTSRLESLLVTNASPHSATDYLIKPEAARPVGEVLAAGLQ